MHAINDWISHRSGPVVYLVVALLVFAEDALFCGFVIPGETAVVLGGVLAGQGKVSVVWLAIAVVVAAVAGDSVGYEVGKHFGPRLLQTRIMRPHAARVAKTQEFIRKRGPLAVFLGRFVAFFRAMMPALVGLSRMEYRRFVVWNALGGLVWGVGYTLLGYFAGNAYKRIEHQVGTGAAVGIAALVVLLVVVAHFRKRRKEKAEEASAVVGSAPAASAESVDEPSA